MALILFVCMHIFTNFNYVHVELLTILAPNDDSSQILSTAQIQPQSANAVAVEPVINTTQPSCGMDIVYSLYIVQCTYVCSYS